MEVTAVVMDGWGVQMKTISVKQDGLEEMKTVMDTESVAAPPSRRRWVSNLSLAVRHIKVQF